MEAPILELDGVSKQFGATVTADNLSLGIERGEFFTFLGPSGSGKSTILRLIAGLETPDSGRICIDGRDMARVPPWQRNLGMVFQQYALFPHMSVTENVAYGLKVRRTATADMEQRVGAMLSLIGLVGMAEKNVTLLSGGEQQRVALARALVLRPTLLLLDEPLSALDEKIRREMQTELKHIQRRIGTSFLYVTHDQEEALTMSDRIAVMRRGVAVQCDAPERLFRRPRTRFVARFFRGCNIIDADVLERRGGQACVGFAGSILRVADHALPASAARIGLAIRAESLRLGEAATPCEIHLTAELGEIVYRGSNVDHLLELADGQRLVVTSTRRETPAERGTVQVGFYAADITPLEDDA
jgi:ABC-type Fe3+/spermidine/putrescine transport system ATPase subunit